MLSPPLKVQPRRERLQRLLQHLRPTRTELAYFLADKTIGERLDEWEEGVRYFDGDVVDDFVAWRRDVAANQVASRQGHHGDLDENERARRWALTLADALKAETDLEVQRWRTGWLDGQTVTWEEMETTLRSMPVEDRDPDGRKRWMRLSTPDWDKPDYQRPRIRVDGSRALESLEAIAARLVKQWWWSTEQAVVFVVTGLPPLAWTLRAETKDRFPGRLRVVLTIDPAVPVDYVVRAYVAARRPYVRAGRPIEAETWDAVSWRLSHLDESAADAARGWLRRRGVEADRAAINAWRRKVNAALDRLDFDKEEST